MYLLGLQEGKLLYVDLHGAAISGERRRRCRRGRHTYCFSPVLELESPFSKSVFRCNLCTLVGREEHKQQERAAEKVNLAKASSSKAAAVHKQLAKPGPVPPAGPSNPHTAGYGAASSLAKQGSGLLVRQNSGKLLAQGSSNIARTGLDDLNRQSQMLERKLPMRPPRDPEGHGIHSLGNPLQNKGHAGAVRIQGPILPDIVEDDPKSAHPLTPAQLRQQQERMKEDKKREEKKQERKILHRKQMEDSRGASTGPSHAPNPASRNVAQPARPDVARRASNGAPTSYAQNGTKVLPTLQELTGSLSILEPEVERRNTERRKERATLWEGKICMINESEPACITDMVKVTIEATNPHEKVARLLRGLPHDQLLSLRPIELDGVSEAIKRTAAWYSEDEAVPDETTVVMSHGRFLKGKSEAFKNMLKWGANHPGHILELDIAKNDFGSLYFMARQQESILLCLNYSTEYMVHYHPPYHKDAVPSRSIRKGHSTAAPREHRRISWCAEVLLDERDDSQKAPKLGEGHTHNAAEGNCLKNPTQAEGEEPAQSLGQASKRLNATEELDASPMASMELGHTGKTPTRAEGEEPAQSLGQASKRPKATEEVDAAVMANMELGHKGKNPTRAKEEELAQSLGQASKRFKATEEVDAASMANMELGHKVINGDANCETSPHIDEGDSDMDIDVDGMNLDQDLGASSVCILGDTAEVVLAKGLEDEIVGAPEPFVSPSHGHESSPFLDDQRISEDPHNMFLMDDPDSPLEFQLPSLPHNLMVQVGEAASLSNTREPEPPVDKQTQLTVLLGHQKKRSPRPLHRWMQPGVCVAAEVRNTCEETNSLAYLLPKMKERADTELKGLRVLLFVNDHFLDLASQKERQEANAPGLDALEAVGVNLVLERVPSPNAATNESTLQPGDVDLVLVPDELLKGERAPLHHMGAYLLHPIRFVEEGAFLQVAAKKLSCASQPSPVLLADLIQDSELWPPGVQMFMKRDPFVSTNSSTNVLRQLLELMETARASKEGHSALGLMTGKWGIKMRPLDMDYVCGHAKDETLGLFLHAVNSGVITPLTHEELSRSNKTDKRPYVIRDAELAMLGSSKKRSRFFMVPSIPSTTKKNEDNLEPSSNSEIVLGGMLADADTFVRRLLS
eukprot:gene13598-19471_t